MMDEKQLERLSQQPASALAYLKSMQTALADIATKMESFGDLIPKNRTRMNMDAALLKSGKRFVEVQRIANKAIQRQPIRLIKLPSQTAVRRGRVVPDNWVCPHWDTVNAECRIGSNCVRDMNDDRCLG